MSSSLRVIVVCAALVTWLPAQAQFLGFGLETNVELTKQDLDIIRHTVNGHFAWPGSRLCSTLRRPSVGHDRSFLRQPCQAQAFEEALAL
jgi:hypothetical protein